MATMKALRIHEYGGLDSLRYEDAPIPQPGKGQVRIRIHAASINPVDWEVPSGIYQEFMGRALPTVLGFDVSGVIDQVGEDVDTWSSGDDVYAQCDYRYDGSFAEFMVIDVPRLARKPRNLDHVQAASVPVCAMAAWMGLFGADAIALRSAQTVLIHGAAGGVGMFAVQLAKWRGAKVIATASARDENFVRELGADQFVDYATQRFEDVSHEVDGVLDPIGGAIQARSLGVIKAGGTLASLVGDHWTQTGQGQHINKMIVHGGHFSAELPKITELLENGAIRTKVARVLSLADVSAALREAQAGKLRGKSVVKIR